jgi:hypothetical protein
MHKIWIEAALNGAWSRALQPGIPDTIEAIVSEGVACARAGATIIHTHAYDGAARKPSTGRSMRASLRAFVRKSMFPSIRPILRSRRQRPARPLRSPMPRFASPISKRSPRAACSSLRWSTPAASISR